MRKQSEPSIRRRWLSSSWPVGAAFSLLVLVAAACSSDDICEYGENQGCDASAVADGPLTDVALPDGSIPDVNVPDSEPPPGCTTPDEPLKNPEKCLVDAFGAFVSPTGDDSNPGTKARPFKTLGKAIGTTQARIVVCEGSYSESVEITRSLSILSGIDCAFSKAGGKARLTAGKPEFAVSIAKPASAVGERESHRAGRERGREREAGRRHCDRQKGLRRARRRFGNDRRNGRCWQRRRRCGARVVNVEELQRNAHGRRWGRRGRAGRREGRPQRNS